MKYILAIVLIASLAIGMAGFSGVGHHTDVSSMNCAAVCLQAMRPVVTGALIAAIVVLFAIFETFAAFFDTITSKHFDTRFHTRFRSRFDRWFSLLEHSPTA